jgi:hypothetical protein
MNREQRDRERREYEADVEYAVWRNGGNPDQVNRDRVDDCYYAGRYHEEAATAELRRQHERKREVGYGY